jgi:hypothetical protein
MADLLTSAHFTPHLGSTFRLPDVEGVTLVLTEAKALASRRGLEGAPAGSREPFELIFLGPARPILPQQIHRLETEGMDALDIFIVAIGPRDGGIAYQAIFN